MGGSPGGPEQVGVSTLATVAAGNGADIWAERFDRTLEDIFAVQDEITDPIAAAIQPVSSSVSQ